jgi:hypothetical protein
MKAGQLSEFVRQVNPAALTELFGHDTAEGLQELARQIDFMSASPQKLGAGAIAIGAITLAPLAHIPTLIDLAIGAHLYRSPTFLNWLVLGMQGDRTAGKMIERIVQGLSLGAHTAAPVFGPSTNIGEGPRRAMAGVGNVMQQDIQQGFRADPIMKVLGLTNGAQ